MRKSCVVVLQYQKAKFGVYTFEKSVCTGWPERVQCTFLDRCVLCVIYVYIQLKEEEILDTCGDRAGWPEFHARLLLIRCLFSGGHVAEKEIVHTSGGRERAGWPDVCIEERCRNSLYI